MSAARPSEAVIRNALQAAQSCGVVIGAIEITADGSVRIEAARPESVDSAPKLPQPARPKQWAK